MPITIDYFIHVSLSYNIKCALSVCDVINESTLACDVSPYSLGPVKVMALDYVDDQRVTVVSRSQRVCM